MPYTTVTSVIRANNGLNRDIDSIQLGGPLTEVTSIGTSATNTLALTGLQSGSLADSLVVADRTTGVLRRMPTTTISNVIRANNGLNRDADSIQLGGPLTEPTTVTTSATNTLALAGLQGGSLNDSVVVADRTTGVIRRIPYTMITGVIRANNGLTRLVDSIQLGGLLTKPTTITADINNTLAIQGLQAGASTDSLVSVNPVTGVLRKIDVNTTGAITTASNGLTKVGNDVRLGGLLTGNTVINSANFTLTIGGPGSSGGVQVTNSLNAGDLT